MKTLFKILGGLLVLFLLFGVFVAPKLIKHFEGEQGKAKQKFELVKVKNLVTQANMEYTMKCYDLDKPIEVCHKFNEVYKVECAKNIESCDKVLQEIQKASAAL